MMPAPLRLAPLAAMLLVPACAGAQRLDDARALQRSGKYQEAITAYAEVPAASAGWAAAQRGLVRTLATVGRYDEAEATARRATASAAGRELWNVLGEVLQARGKTDEAEQAFTRALAEHASDSLTASLHLAELHYERGDRDRAFTEFDRFIDVYNDHADALDAEQMADVATACRYLGERNPELFKDALRAFDRAIQRGGATPAGDEARVALGELFLLKYNGADARSSFSEVLQANPSNPRALLGAARQRDFDGERGADSLVQAALRVNPGYPEAHVFRAELAIDLEDYAGAEREVDRALAVNPSLSAALGVKAAIRSLAGDTQGFAAARARALQVNPHDAELYNTLAELTARVRQYREAAEFARQAVQLDPRSWRAYGLLGMNQLRLGEIAAGRQTLETSFRGDPYNVWIKNTLDLLDTYKNYDTTRSGHFVFMIGKSESPLLEPYLAELGERAYARFAARYAYTPPAPIRIEVYRSHADFSVRTVGLAGLGALGVSFGTTLAFDSPAARDAGPFNWGSTVWHELAHTFTLGATDHRIPRWLSEGLSVYEEHHARPGWGFEATPAFLSAYRAGKLVPVSRMNDGFMHPAYPEQVMYSYYQASLVCELIARDWGEGALLKMLQGYRAGLGTDQVFQRVLGTDLAGFDKRFDAYLRQRFATPLAGLDEFVARMAGARVLFEQRQYDAAAPLFARALALFPDYGGDNGPYWYLAKIAEARGDTARAAEMLTRLVSLNETNYQAYVDLSVLRERLGDVKGAAEALDGAMYVNPYDVAMHQRLALLYQKAGDPQKVVRERRAVVALAPVDRADALYELAVAYRDAGDGAAARTTLLRALEQAPNFEKAQALLLTLHREEKP
ncbi:MAG TPA: tetratricopeptide repeat protein [Gemmatimonadaceae bacterium]|nr:tetratricopeptide repeat protein [Gemmatimonadaceae bacterium]